MNDEAREGAALEGAAVSISSEVLCREIQGESVLLDLRSQSYFGLDDVGTRFWHLLQEHGELAAVVAAVTREFQVDRARVERDLRSLIAELEAADLVTVRWPAASSPVSDGS